jgi:hypothetical protein
LFIGIEIAADTIQQLLIARKYWADYFPATKSTLPEANTEEIATALGLWRAAL